MLNNHLTFILSGCRYLALGLVIVSCAKVVSNQSNEPSLKRGTVKNESCYSRHQDFGESCTNKIKCFEKLFFKLFAF